MIPALQALPPANRLSRLANSPDGHLDRHEEETKILKARQAEEIQALDAKQAEIELLA